MLSIACCFVTSDTDRIFFDSTHFDVSLKSETFALTESGSHIVDTVSTLLGVISKNDVKPSRGCTILSVEAGFDDPDGSLCSESDTEGYNNWFLHT